MNDTITQMRLSMRLDSYQRDYGEKREKRDALYKDEWNRVWYIADAARSNNTLTPQLVDNVRLALNKGEA